MSEVVDSIIADLDVRYEGYVRGFDAATAAHQRFTKSLPKAGAMGGFTQAEAQQYADRHAKVGQTAEAAGEKRKRAAKGASDAEKAAAKASADAAKAAAKERADAAKKTADAEKAAAREAAQATRDRVKGEREAQIAIARVREGEINTARRQRAEIRRLRSVESETTAQAQASTFLAPLGARGLSGTSARNSAEVFREQFRIEAKEAKEAAAAEALLAKEREKAGNAAAIASAKEAEREARLSAVAERAAARAGVTRGTGAVIGATVPREGTGQRAIPAAALNAVDDAGDVAKVAEVNHLLADRFDLQQRLRFAQGAEKRELADQIDLLARINRYKSAGLAEDEAMLRAEREMVAISRLRAEQDRRKATSGVTQFARGAGVGGIGAGGTAAVAGVATAVGVGVGVEIIQAAVEYGKALDDLSKQLSITVEDLQAYQKIARDTGVETTTLSSAFGQFASNLGRAQQGQEEYSKVFRALGVDIKDFKTTGEALPTVIDRISQLKDPLERAAVETRLFGEEGRKLDPLLSGGAEAVSKLSASLQETGRALSAREIQELDETARKLADVKNQLSVDFARIVAGNADAITGLANSFAILAGKIVETIGRLQQFGAAQIQRGIISNFASDEQKQAARAYQLSTKEGRVKLFGEAEARERDILAGNGRFRVGAGQPSIGEQREAALAAVRAEKREIARFEASTRPAVTPPVQTGTVNQGLLRTLGAPKPPKGPKGKSAEQLEREQEQRDSQYNDQVAQLTADFLRAQQDLTGSAEKRADIELKLLDTATAANIADIESQRKRNVLAGADEKTEAARAAVLTAKEREARNERAAVIEQERRFAKERALTTATASLLDARATVLSAELSLARTAAERRRIGSEIVDNQEARERARLDGVIRTSPANSPEAAQAKAELERLPAQTALQKRLVTDQNRDPLDQYREDLRAVTQDTNAALQSIEVNALQSLEDSLARSIGKVVGLKGAFGDMITGILTDLARLEIKKGILAFLGAGGEGGGAGGFLAGLARSIGLGGGRASGGNVVGGRSYLVGENGPEILAMPSSGRVYPNGALPGIAASNSRTVKHYNITVNADNSVTPQDFGAALARQILAEADRMDGTRQVQSIDAAPARIQRVSTLGS